MNNPLNFKITSWTGPLHSTNGNLYPINVTAEKLCNAIKSNYYKVSLSNFWRQKLNATGLLIEYD